MRGEVWTVAGSGYATKPRPAVIIQNDAIANINSTILCLITTFNNPDISVRVNVEPSRRNGLEETSFVMVDKIVTVSSDKLGEKIGCLEQKYVRQIENCLKTLLLN